MNMVSQDQVKAPEQKTSRERRRERRIETLSEQRRVKKITRKLRQVTFDNDTVTEAANFQFMELFKQLIGLDEIIAYHLTVAQAKNSMYTAQELIDYLIDCAILGHTRFLHMDALQADPGYQTIKEIERFPDESTFRSS